MACRARLSRRSPRKERETIHLATFPRVAGAGGVGSISISPPAHSSSAATSIHLSSGALAQSDRRAENHGSNRLNGTWTGAHALETKRGGLHRVTLKRPSRTACSWSRRVASWFNPRSQPVEIVAGANLGERLLRLNIDDRSLLERHERRTFITVPRLSPSQIEKPTVATLAISRSLEA